VITSDNCPEFNSYNTKECREAGQYINARTNADYLPLTPSDPDTIMTAMSKAKSLTVKYTQDFIYEIMESTFGEVSKMLNGKKFLQNMHALRLVVEELLRSLFNAQDLTSMTWKEFLKMWHMRAEQLRSGYIV